ncbi:MAG: 2,3-bisphosphoglycerate-independent phosphoglycerate mutase, partial [Patescibacteria group bacterium]
MKTKRPVVLCIIDGWGLGTDDAHNAIFLAKTPNIDNLLKNYPNGPIGAAGENIGLTPGHQGSSEMGHMIIGAGRNVLLPQTQVSQTNFSKNKILLEALEHAKTNGTRVHIMGLLSNAGVHSYLKTGIKFLEIAKKKGINELYWHVFADGRDSPPKSALDFIKPVQAKMNELNLGQFASLMGRWWVMDRDENWDRIERAYMTLTEGKSLFTAGDINEAINKAYGRDEVDELIKPTIINKQGLIKAGDVVLNFNYRVDRAIQITKAFIEPDFSKFTRADHWDQIYYTALTAYYQNMPCPTMLVQPKPINILGEVLADRGYSQYRLAETEKWVYVTKCMNSMKEKPFKNEERHLIPSDKIKTFDLKPEMQALPIASKFKEVINQKKHDVIILNLANPDMVGHTGNQPAIIKACETVDQAIGIIYE